MRTTTARGGAAGAVGVVAMDVATWVLYRQERKADLLREKHLRPYGKDTAHAPVRRATKPVGSDAGATTSPVPRQLRAGAPMRHQQHQQHLHDMRIGLAVVTCGLALGAVSAVAVANALYEMVR